MFKSQVANGYMSIVPEPAQCSVHTTNAPFRAFNHLVAKRPDKVCKTPTSSSSLEQNFKKGLKYAVYSQTYNFYRKCICLCSLTSIPFQTTSEALQVVVNYFTPEPRLQILGFDLSFVTWFQVHPDSFRFILDQ